MSEYKRVAVRAVEGERSFQITLKHVTGLTFKVCCCIITHLLVLISPIFSMEFNSVEGNI